MDNLTKDFVAEIILRAIKDVRGLQSMGAIIDGDVATEWPTTPKGRRRTLMNDYRFDTDVKELLAFFQDGWLDEMIDASNLDLDADLMREGLKLNKQKC